MGGAARPRDDHLEARALRPLGESIEPVGRAVGGNDPRLVSDRQGVEGLGSMLEGRPIRLASHDDRDRLCRHVRSGRDPTRAAQKEAADYRNDLLRSKRRSSRRAQATRNLDARRSGLLRLWRARTGGVLVPFDVRCSFCPATPIWWFAARKLSDSSRPSTQTDPPSATSTISTRPARTRGCN